MKIVPKEIHPIDQHQITKKTDMVSGEGFQDILREKMDEAQVAGKQSFAVPPSSNLAGIRLDVANQAERTQTLGRIGRFLDLLEAYQQKMDDPRVTLKETYPLVTRMEREAEDLLPVLEALPEGDEMKDLLNRLLVTSTVAAYHGSILLSDSRHGNYLINKARQV
jgi:hypothetical protein